MTEWRDISGYDGEYQISDDGRAKRKTLTYRNRFNPILAIKKVGSYKGVWLGGRSGRNHYLHRLVAFAFIGPPPSDAHEVAHYDGDKTNNHVSNLRWATRSENNLDKRRLNTHPKLTQAQVDEIRSRKGQTATELSKEFCVGFSHIRRIQKREAWA